VLAHLTPKFVSERWNDYLDPEVNVEPFPPDELVAIKKSMLMNSLAKDKKPQWVGAGAPFVQPWDTRGRRTRPQVTKDTTRLRRQAKKRAASESQDSKPKKKQKKQKQKRKQAVKASHQGK
jgi:hypothetical protein